MKTAKLFRAGLGCNSQESCQPTLKTFCGYASAPLQKDMVESERPTPPRSKQRLKHIPYEKLIVIAELLN